MNINISALKKAIDTCKNNLNNYELTAYNVLSIIKNMTYYWKDGYTESFFKKIEIEINNLKDITNTVDIFVKALEIVYTYYIELNNRREIVDKSDNMIIDFEINEKIRNNEEISKEIINIENNISDLLTKLKVPEIIKETYDNLSINNIELSSFVGMKDNIPKEITKAETENNNLNILKEILLTDLNEIINIYKTKNTMIIAKTINKLNEIITIFNSNIDNALEYAKMRENEIFKTLTSELVDSTIELKK